MAESLFDGDAILTTSFIRHVEIHEELGSTSDRAGELARAAQIQLPALVVAEVQTAGRGRGRNIWWSSSGSLTFSVLFDPIATGITTSMWPKLSLSAAVAVCDAIMSELSRAHGPGMLECSPPTRVGIKWPNDVILDGAKIAGILIESLNAPPPAKSRAILGIGINVNNSWASAPRAAGANGIALCDSTRRQHAVQPILLAVLNALEKRMNQLAMSDPSLQASCERLCWLTEKRVEVETNGNWMHGICVGIADDGALLVENASGAHRVLSGSVRVI